MKKITTTTLTIWLIGIGFAQEIKKKDQNPNYQESLKKYQEKLKNSPDSKATTVQDTYKAIDEWQYKKDAKIANKRLRIKNRHERKMARINNKRYYNSNPGLHYDSPYSFPYQRRKRWSFYPRIGVGANVGFSRIYIGF